MAVSPFVLATVAGGATPVDSAANTFIGYIASLGIAGIGLVILFWLYVWPGNLTKRARDEARADLVAENERLRGEKHHAEEQRDEALRVARDAIAPVLLQFNATTSALLPVLQDIVRRQESTRRAD